MKPRISTMIRLLGLTLCLALTLAPAGPAWSLEGLQITEIQGRLLDGQGQKLDEFDYLEPGQRYRLMPDCAAELSSLDGQTTWRIKGPGVLVFEASGRVKLNGRELVSGRVGQNVSGTSTGAGQTMAARVMRGQEGVRVVTTSPGGKSRTMRLYSGYHALVIGCSKYSNGWPPLPNPVKDATEIADLLSSLGWKVETVTDPTGRELRKALNSLITGPGRRKDMAIMVWFSGHGHTLAEADGSRLGYIVPVDAPDPATDEMGFMEKAVSMRQVETVARRVMSKHVLMMFDSCFSGALFQITRAKPSAFIEEKAAKPVRQFVTAGNENEEVPDNSYFKTVFIQGLGEGYADRNRDGYVTGQEMGAYLQEQVVNYSRKAQHPQYGKIANPKLDKGDFVFVLRQEEPVEQTPLVHASSGNADQSASAAPAAPARSQTRIASVNAAPAAVPAIKDPPPVDHKVKLELGAMVRQWNIDWNRLDAPAILSHYAEDASISIKIRKDKLKVSKADFRSMLPGRIRRVQGRFNRRIVKVMDLQASGSRAKVFLKTRIAGPGGTGIIVERLELVKQGERWLIAKYRFNKVADAPPPTQAQAGSKGLPNTGDHQDR